MRNKAVFILSITFLLFIGCSPLTSIEKLSRNIDSLYAKVEQLYSRLIDRKPADQSLRLSLARFYYKNRDYLKARDALVSLSSQESRLLLAKTYAHLKDFTSALEIFQRFRDVKEEEALFLFGLSLQAKNLFPQAKSVYKSISKEPYKDLAGKKLDALKIKFDQKVPSYLKEIMASCPGLDKFPNASSIIVSCDEKVRLTEDNRSIVTIHVLVKVLNDKGRKDWGEVEIGYDSTYEKVDLDFARTITPDGRVLSVGKENIRDVSKYLNFPLYSNSRAYIISMPEVLKDSFIEYKVTIHRSRLINEKDISFIYRIKESQPVLDCKLELIAPEDKDIFFHKLNTGYLPGHISLDSKEERSQGQKHYTFIFKDIPQFIPEAHMVSPSFTNPALVISSFSHWQGFYEWWTRLYKDKLKVTPQLKAFLKELIKGADSEHEKARRIAEFCAEKIRYVAIEYGEAGFEPHFAEEVFLNKYGDCKDQAMLLITLLREAGLKAYPVLIPTKSAYNLDKKRAASYFNHAIACVELGGKIIFMDPTSSTTSFKDLPPSDQNRNVLIFFEDRYQIMTTPVIEENSLKIKMVVDINEREEARIQRSVTTNGYYASGQRYYLRFTQPQLIADNLREKMKSFASLSKLVDFNIENADLLDKDPTLRYDFLAYNLLSKVQNLRIVPVLGEEIIDTSWINRDVRSWPLYLNSPHEITIEAWISLPANLEIQYVPEDLEIKSRWLDFSLSCKEKGDTLLFTERLRTKEETVSEADYLEFKSLIEEILQSLKQQIVLKKIR